MDLSHPQSAVVPSLDGEVLVVLSRTTRPLSGRQVSRLVRRGSWSGVYRALQRLASQGIVDEWEAAPAILYSLNRDHVAAPAVEALSTLRGELLRRLEEAIAQWTLQPVHASVFGSAARGEGGPDSDIDVLIVRPRDVSPEDEQWQNQLHHLAGSIFRWTGNSAGIAEVPEADLARLRRNDPSIVRELQRDAVRIAGPSVDHILGRVSEP